MKEVSINPYYQFSYKDSDYLIDIENMQTHQLSKHDAEVLKISSKESKKSRESELISLLSNFDLLVDDPQGQHAYEVNSRAKKVPVATIVLLLTQACNLKCSYCYGDAGRYGEGGKMNKKTAFQAIDWLMEASGEKQTVRVGFLGGEPMLSFELMRQVILYAEHKVEEKGKRIFFYTTTNGTLLDDESIAFLKEHDVSVQVSLDGPKELHDAQRPFANNEGSFDVIVPRLKKLLKEMPNSSGHAVLEAGVDPALVRKALRKTGLTEITILPATGSLFNDTGDRKNTTDHSAPLFKCMENDAEEWIKKTKDRDIDALEVLATTTQFFAALQSILHGIKNYYPCGAGMGLLGVSSSGDLYLCHRFVGMDKYKLGSIFQKEINRDAYEESPTSESLVCKTCFARYYCAGGCKHDNATATGSLLMPSEDTCKYRRRQLELAAYVISSLGQKDRAFLTDKQILPSKPCPLDF